MPNHATRRRLDVRNAPQVATTYITVRMPACPPAPWYRIVFPAISAVGTSWSIATMRLKPVAAPSTTSDPCNRRRHRSGSTSQTASGTRTGSSTQANAR